MKILVTGPYEENYNRTRIILNGLKRLGHEVIERPLKIHQLSAIAQIQCDLVYLPCFMHKAVPKAKKYATAPLVFDPT